MVLTTPSRGLLLSFPLQTQSVAAARISLEFEALHPFPLMLDPFALEDGHVTWDGDGLDDGAEIHS
jgi:hypothetical protein